MDTESLIVTLLLLSPLLIGGCIWWLKPAFALSYGTRFDHWVLVQKDKAEQKQERIVPSIIYLVLAGFATLSTWAGRKVADDYGRCGLRIALYLYVVLGLAALLYAVVVIAMFILGLLMLWGILRMIGAILHEQDAEQNHNSSFTDFDDTSPPSRAPETDVMPLAVGKGDLYSGTTWLNETQLGNVDADGRIMQGTNWLTKEQIGSLDADGNIFKGTNWTDKTQIGNVDADGRIYKGTNWTDKEQIGRIDEDGNVYEGVGWLKEKHVGRVKPKE